MNYKFNPSTIAFAVITYYPKWYRGKLRSLKHTDKVRGDLAIEFFKKAIRIGCQLVVADGKSSSTFRQILSQIPGLILIKRRSQKRSSARRQVIKRVSALPNIKAIISTEAEKTSLLDSLDKIVNPILENKADIVIPKRNEELFKESYPSYMYESEVEGNMLYNEILRTNGLLNQSGDFDMFFGPRAIVNKKPVLKLFTRKYHLKIAKKSYLDSHFDYEDYSATQHFPIIMALKKGMKVQSVTVDFSYPVSQKENEERGQRSLFEEKRKNQRMIILTDLLYFLNFLETHKN